MYRANLKKHLGARVGFLLLTLFLVVSCGSPRQSQPVSDVEFDFSGRKNFALTGGVTEAAGLTGFQRDSFGSFFAESVREILTERGLSEVGESHIDSADYIIRYILRDKLIITALEPTSRRLIWRGQSEKSLTGEKLSLPYVAEMVKQAIDGFPPGN